MTDKLCFMGLISFVFTGTDYYSVHYSPSYLQQEFAITPLENNTHVFVTLSDDLFTAVSCINLNLALNC